MATIDEYFDNPQIALFDLVEDSFLSGFIRDGDFPESDEGAMAAVPLSMNGAQKVIRRVFATLKINIGMRWRNFWDWVCSPRGFNWCGKVLKLGRKGAVKALRDALKKRGVRIGVQVVGLLDPTAAILAFLGYMTGELDDRCECDVQARDHAPLMG